MNSHYEFYRIFYTVALYGSISKAANALYLSQPAVTQTIKKLEKDFHCNLFVRTAKGVELTQEGTIFFDFIKNGIECFTNGEHKLNSLKNLETGTIRIGASTTVTQYYLLPYIKLFHEQYPSIDISITNHLTQNLLDSLRKGSLDVLLVNLPMEKAKDLQITSCVTVQDCFATSSHFPELTKGRISLADLVENYPIVTQKEPSNTRQFLNSIMKTYQIEFHPKFDIVSYSLVKSFAKIGLGVAYVTKEFTKEDFSSKELFPISLIEGIPSRELGIVCLKDSIPSFATQKLISLLLKK